MPINLSTTGNTYLHVALQRRGGGKAALAHAALKRFAGAGKRETEKKSAPILSFIVLMSSEAATCASSGGSLGDPSERKPPHTPDSCTSYLLNH